MEGGLSGPRPRIRSLQQHINLLLARLSFVDLHLKDTHRLTHCLTICGVDLKRSTGRARLTQKFSATSATGVHHSHDGLRLISSQRGPGVKPSCGLLPVIRINHRQIWRYIKCDIVDPDISRFHNARGTYDEE